MIVEAKLVKLKSEDGFWEMLNYVQLGTVYEVDTETIRIARVWNRKLRKEASTTVIRCTNGTWLPVELLELPGNC